MDDGDCDGGGSFRVKHGSDAAEVMDVPEARAGEVGDVVGEREMMIKSNTKIADRGYSLHLHLMPKGHFNNLYDTDFYCRDNTLC